jgi:tetratricopeptide (TPR) repeat protein
MALDDVRRADHRSALRRYTRLTGLDPDNPNLHLKVAELSLRLENKAGAIDAYLKAASLFVRDAFDAKAVSLYKQALRIDPKRYEICDLLATTYQRIGRVGDAIQALDTAAKTLEQEGRSAESLVFRRRIAQLNPADTNSRARLARDLNGAGLRDDAVAEYVEVAIQLARQGEPEHIPAIFESILALKPEDVGAASEAHEQVFDDVRLPSRAPLDFQPTRKRQAAPDSTRTSSPLGYRESLEKLYRRIAQIYREAT